MVLAIVAFTMVPYGTEIWKKQCFMTAARITSLCESILCQRIYVRPCWNAVIFIQAKGPLQQSAPQRVSPRQQQFHASVRLAEKLLKQKILVKYSKGQLHKVDARCFKNNASRCTTKCKLLLRVTAACANTCALQTRSLAMVLRSSHPVFQ